MWSQTFQDLQTLLYQQVLRFHKLLDLKICDMIFWLVQQWSLRQPLAKQRYSKNTNDMKKFSALQKNNDVIYTGRSTYIEFIEGVQHFGFFRPSRIPEITFWVPERNSQVPSRVIIDPPKNPRAVPKSQPQKGLSSINKW